MAIIPNSNVNLASNVRDVLNGVGGSVGNNVTSFFTADAIKAEFSKYKPVVYANQPFLDDERRWKGDNNMCGFTSGSVMFNDVSALVAAYDSGSTFVYDVPSGGTSRPMRLGDFRGYNTDAKAPIWDFYVNRAFVSSDSASTIDCELVDNHSGINAAYNLILADFGVSDWFFGCIIKAGNGYFTKKHSDMIGGSAIITNRIITVSYSEVSNRVGSFYSYKVYPCLINGAGNRFMAVPSAASGGVISGGVSGSVIQQQAAVGWTGNTYAYTGGSFVSFRGVLGYGKGLEGSNVSITINVWNNGSIRQQYSTSHFVLSHTEVSGSVYRMDFSHDTKWNKQDGDTYEMIVVGGSSSIASTSIPVVINTLPPL